MKLIRPDMTLLDIVHDWPDTIAVFRSWDTVAETCLLCTALFETVENVALQHDLNLQALLAELEAVASR